MSAERHRADQRYDHGIELRRSVKNPRKLVDPSGPESRIVMSMGTVNGNILLKNPKLPNLDPVEVVALADSGILHLCIPEHIRIQLRLEEIDRKEVTLADGTRKLVP